VCIIFAAFLGLLFTILPGVFLIFSRFLGDFSRLCAYILLVFPVFFPLSLYFPRVLVSFWGGCLAIISWFFQVVILAIFGAN